LTYQPAGTFEAPSVSGSAATATAGQVYTLDLGRGQAASVADYMVYWGDGETTEVPGTATSATHVFNGSESSVNITVVSFSGSQLNASSCLGMATQDVTVSAPSGQAPLTCTWTGEGTDTNWSDAKNWEIQVGATTVAQAPQPGDNLVFPVASTPDTVDDFSPGTTFNSIEFSDGFGEFTVSGNSFALVQGLTVDSGVSGSITISNALGGSGAVAQDGTGTLTLSGVNSYSGGTTIGPRATLQVGDFYGNGTLGGPGGLVIDNGSLLLCSYASNGDEVVPNNIVGAAGTVEAQGGGTIVLTGTNAYGGGTTIDPSTTLQVGDGTTNGALGSGPVTSPVGWVGSFNLVFDPNGTMTIPNDILGGIDVQQIGAGTSTLILSGTNSYFGGTTVDDGTLQVGGNSALPGNPDGNDLGVTVDLGATLDLAGWSPTITNLSGDGTVTTSAANVANSRDPALLTITGTVSHASAFDGTITDGSLRDWLAIDLDANNGTQWLGGDNTYSGGTTIAAGATLQVGDFEQAGTLGSGPINDNGTLVFCPWSGSEAIPANISGSGAIEVQIGGKPGYQVALSGDVECDGGITIDADATLEVTCGASGGTVDVPTISGPTESNLIFDPVGTLTVTSDITGAVSVQQDGPGTTVLSPTTGRNTYNGSTTVVEGALVASSLSASLPGYQTWALVWVDQYATLAVTNANDLATLDDPSENQVYFVSGACLGFDTTNSDPNNTSPVYIDNNITDEHGAAIGFTKLGTGTLVLGGTGSTYTGGTTVQTGVLELAAISPSDLGEELPGYDDRLTPQVTVDTGAALAAADAADFATLSSSSSSNIDYESGSFVGYDTGSQSVSYSTGIAGYGGMGVMELGGGTLTLSNAGNSYTGGSAAADGTLVASVSGALPSGTVVTLGEPRIGDGVLQLDCNQTVDGLYCDGAVPANDQVVNALVGGSTLTLTVEVPAGVTDAFTGVIGGGPGASTTENDISLVVDGGATSNFGLASILVLGNPNNDNQPNTYTGRTTVASGVLEAYWVVSLPLTGGVTVQSGAALAASYWDLDSNYPSPGNGLLGEYQSITFQNGSFLGIDTTSSGDFTCYENIGDSYPDAGLMKLGPSTLTMAASQSYQGDTVVNDGTLQLGVASAVPSGTGAGNLEVDHYGVFDINGNPNVTVNGLNGTGTILNDAGGDNAGNINVGANDQSSEFDGQIVDGSSNALNGDPGPLTLKKVGAGTLILTGDAFGGVAYNGTLNANDVSEGELKTGELAADISASGATLLNLKDQQTYYLGPSSKAPGTTSWTINYDNTQPTQWTSSTDHTYTARGYYVVTAIATAGSQQGTIYLALTVIDPQTYTVYPFNDGGGTNGTYLISTALEDAMAGDTIEVEPGTYSLDKDLSHVETGGNVTAELTNAGVPGAPITIEGVSGADNGQPNQQPVIDLGEYYNWSYDSTNGCYYAAIPCDVNQGALSSIAGFPAYATGNDTNEGMAGPSAQPFYGLTVEMAGGFAASPILPQGNVYVVNVDGQSQPPPYDPMDPPSPYFNPGDDSAIPPGYMSNGQLAYNLSWYDPDPNWASDGTYGTLWFRPSEVSQISPNDTSYVDANCAVVSNGSAFAVGQSWVTVEGLTVKNGFTGIQISGTHDIIEDCAVTNCASQGILGSNRSGQIIDNYVDAVGGEVNPGDHELDNLEHDLYVDGGLIENNFFGLAASGSCAQLYCTDFTETTVFSNNVCYGDAVAGIRLDGGNMIVTGNVVVGPQQYLPGFAGSSSDACGISLFDPEPNVIVSGNYIEGDYVGLEIWPSVSWGSGSVVPGVAITHNTIVGSSDTSNDGVVGAAIADFGSLPSVMSANQWTWTGTNPGNANFQFPTGSQGSQDGDYDEFLSWAQAQPLNYEAQSAGVKDVPVMTAAQIAWYNADLVGFDSSLDAGCYGASTIVAQAMTDLRAYAAGQLSTIDGLPQIPNEGCGLAALGTTDVVSGSGTETLGASGSSPGAESINYNATPGAPSPVTAAQGLLARNGEPYTGSYVVALVEGPSFGTFDLDAANGSFVYTPNPGVTAGTVDTFEYLVSDGIGGTNVGMITVTFT
jgi:autotransporter-associated beta strand protein